VLVSMGVLFPSFSIAFSLFVSYFVYKFVNAFVQKKFKKCCKPTNNVRRSPLYSYDQVRSLFRALGHGVFIFSFSRPNRTSRATHISRMVNSRHSPM
jgi:hypothetical protein